MNKSSIFTIDRTGNKYKDIEELPDKIYVDTCAWINAYGFSNGAKGSAMLTDFIGYCLNNSTKLYHSSVVLDEIVHANEKVFLDKLIRDESIPIPRFKNGSIDRKELRMQLHTNYLSKADELEESTHNVINIVRQSSINLEFIEDRESFDDSMKIIKSTGNILDTKDAKHVYVARLYGINSFLTVDSDFYLLDNDNIYTVPNEKILKERLGRDNILLKFDGNRF